MKKKLNIFFTLAIVSLVIQTATFLIFSLGLQRGVTVSQGINIFEKAKLILITAYGDEAAATFSFVNIPLLLLAATLWGIGHAVALKSEKSRHMGYGAGLLFWAAAFSFSYLYFLLPVLLICVVQRNLEVETNKRFVRQVPENEQAERAPERMDIFHRLAFIFLVFEAAVLVLLIYLDLGAQPERAILYVNASLGWLFYIIGWVRIISLFRSLPMDLGQSLLFLALHSILTLAKGYIVYAVLALAVILVFIFLSGYRHLSRPQLQN